MTHNARLVMRPTSADLDNLEAIAAALRSAGQPFVNRTGALRFALRAGAEAVSAPTAPEPAARS